MSVFKNLKVLELASVLAGPGVGQFFAELGAQVIKVENVNGGDVTRTWKIAGEKDGDLSAYFCSVNWGKMSIAVDLNVAAGRDIVQRLAAMSDLVIASYKPGDAEKLGVDYATLARNNAGLIYGQITGYGERNARVGYDAIIQAESGFMSMNGEPGGKSLKMPVALIDILAGHQLKEAMLVAMIEKAATGKGKKVHVSLIEAAVSSLANQATNYLIAGRLPSKQGSAHPNIAPYGELYKTSDGKELMLAVGNDRQFQDLCKILGIPSEKLEKFKRNQARVENRSELFELLSSVINRLESSKLLHLLQASNVPAGEVRNVAEALSAPEIDALKVHADGLTGIKTYVGSANNTHFLPPPHLGEHTRYILSEFLGMRADDIDSLSSGKIIV